MAYRNLERRREVHREWMRQWRLAQGMRPRASLTPEVRFWSKVQRGGKRQCWEWIGVRKTDSHPYGVFYIATRRSVPAHRFSWQLHFGEIPEKMLVLHRCDNPPCVNPRHLFLGTDLDNRHDMIAKGRARHPRHTSLWRQRLSEATRGERHPGAKLTDAQVAEIRRLYATKRYTQTALGAQFGVCQSRISSITLGKGRI